MQRKTFRPLTAHVVEKRFIASDDATPEGWHDTQAAALAAYQGNRNEDAVQGQGQAPAEEEVANAKPRRGRPLKVPK